MSPPLKFALRLQQVIHELQAIVFDLTEQIAPKATRPARLRPKPRNKRKRGVKP